MMLILYYVCRWTVVFPLTLWIRHQRLAPTSSWLAVQCTVQRILVMQSKHCAAALTRLPKLQHQPKTWVLYGRSYRILQTILLANLHAEQHILKHRTCKHSAQEGLQQLHSVVGRCTLLQICLLIWFPLFSVMAGLSTWHVVKSQHLSWYLYNFEQMNSVNWCRQSDMQTNTYALGHKTSAMTYGMRCFTPAAIDVRAIAIFIANCMTACGNRVCR